MHPSSFARVLVFGIGLASPPDTVPSQGSAQGSPGTTSDVAAAKGVKCPEDFQSLYDAATTVLRCRRDVVTWVVTRCAEKEFSTYKATSGADSCGPTEIPGVGTPPGASGARPVACAAAGY